MRGRGRDCGGPRHRWRRCAESYKVRERVAYGRGEAEVALLQVTVARLSKLRRKHRQMGHHLCTAVLTSSLMLGCHWPLHPLFRTGIPNPPTCFPLCLITQCRDFRHCCIVSNGGAGADHCGVACLALLVSLFHICTCLALTEFHSLPLDSLWVTSSIFVHLFQSLRGIHSMQ
jgi:hypothetical protein